jgi:general stress protein 26
MTLQDTKDFLSGHDTCVLATVHAAGLPQAATVGFWHDDTTMDILVGTHDASRKFANLEQNPAVALVVGFEGKETVQIEGVAKEVDQSKIVDKIEQFMAKVPAVRKYAEQPGQTYFLIKPTWLRHTNYAANPQVLETKDFA